nr:MAG TPA: hypothetical protein [Caudoviricetes sp.]
MALGKEEDTGFTSVLPFGPWSRYPTCRGAWRRVGPCLAWVVSHGLVFSMLFGACLGWNVAFLREGLFDGLSWVGPNELSGLARKSVGGSFTCVLEACVVESVWEECRECVDGVKGKPHHSTTCYNGV